ncbi:calsyntenin-1 isoform X3 [Lepeophtheirus salmonis]|uniref:calsyntenin-1 isoform X3 n=1 Tax=Lepeophtheirus salmonis TaxID=72036 RepID=UPI001AE5A401|nr:calsyntenin-1-like isoform X2 [Lepeophtheirus salmonis]
MFKYRFIIFFTTLHLSTSHKINSNIFYLETHGNTGYHGILSENDVHVNVTPPIRAIGELVCFFEIVRHHHNNVDIPFEIEVWNQDAGTALLSAINPLNCEQIQNYQFEIEAVSCSGTYSQRIAINIRVQDVNEFSPRWITNSNPKIELKQGQIYNEIIKIEAFDSDCSSKYGDICGYEIQSKGHPFSISKNGVLSNRKILNFSISHSYILPIVAFDCAMNKSLPLLVTIQVKRPCSNELWEGIASRIDYTPGTGPQSIFSRASLSSCNFLSSKLYPITYKIVVKLKTRNIGKGCDRNTYNLQNQRQLCGANTRSINLLTNSLDWLNIFETHDKQKKEQPSMIKLNGNNGAIIPDEILSNDPLQKKFTLSVWLKHFRNGNKHQKEHVMCKADDHRKNRHHFGIFIRNCKLILLLRQTCKEGEENIFRPAEWRWSMPEVCDGEWHHYALNMNFPEITLIVDGEKWINESNNPEIIDDWPLHPTKDLKTKITVGACWQGSEGKLKHGFDGYLAGLIILPGINEHIEVLKCLHQCAETLQVPASLDISQGTEIIINTGENIIVIDGNDRNDITKLIQQVAYLNTQEFPSAGKRTVAINTRVMYSNNNKTILLSNQKTEINIISVPEPTIKIVGTDNFFREYNDFKLGVRILADLHIIISSNGAYSNNNKMESCSIHINPALNPDHEELNVPESLLRMLNIEGKVSDEGVNMDGGEMVYNYERVLRQVTYTNKKPAYYLNRQFKISCSQMENRFISNEYVQTLTVIHPSVSFISNKIKQSVLSRTQMLTPIVAKNQIHHHGVNVVNAHIHYNKEHSYTTIRTIKFNNNRSTIITVVAVVFFMVMLSMGVVRLRGRKSKKYNAVNDNEMSWDDSPLTITVNPLEVSNI